MCADTVTLEKYCMSRSLSFKLPVVNFLAVLSLYHLTYVLAIFFGKKWKWGDLIICKTITIPTCTRSWIKSPSFKSLNQNIDCLVLSVTRNQQLSLSGSTLTTARKQRPVARAVNARRIALSAKCQDYTGPHQGSNPLAFPSQLVHSKVWFSLVTASWLGLPIKQPLWSQGRRQDSLVCQTWLNHVMSARHSLAHTRISPENQLAVACWYSSAWPGRGAAVIWRAGNFRPTFFNLFTAYQLCTNTEEETPDCLNVPHISKLLKQIEISHIFWHNLKTVPL